MGNAITTKEALHINYRAHNFKVDPEAVDIVMSANVRKTIVTTKVCKVNFLTSEDLDAIKRVGQQATNYLYAESHAWMKHINYKVAYLYDPLVVHHHLDETVTEKIRYGNTAITTTVKPSFKKTFLESIIGEVNI